MNITQYNKCVDRIEKLVDTHIYDKIVTDEMIYFTKKFLSSSDDCPDSIYFGVKGDIQLIYRHPCYDDQEMTLDIIDEDIVDIYTYNDARGLEIEVEGLSFSEAKERMEKYLFSDSIG